MKRAVSSAFGDRVLRWGTALLLTFVTIGPVAWIFLCAFKSDLLGGIPSRLLSGWTLHNFADLRANGLGRAILNSVVVGLGSSFLSTGLATLLGFGFICRARPLLGPLLLVISGRLLPAALFLLPQFLLARAMGLSESRFVLVLVHAFSGLSLALILLSPFILRVHMTFNDQIRIDRAPGAIYLWRVMVPLLKLPLGFCMLAVFLLSWTDFLFSSLFTVSEEARTLPVLVGTYLTSYSTLWGPMYAAVCVSFLCSGVFVSVAAVGRKLLVR